MDSALHDSAFELLSAALQRIDGRWAVAFDGLVLKSVFQPVYSLSHARPVGHEALVRAFDASGASVEPGQALCRGGGFEERLRGDRAARMIHALNFAELVGADPHWLFVNVESEVFVAIHQVLGDGFQKALLERSGLRGPQLVLEVLEQQVPSDADFDGAVRAVRAAGGLIAIDDFGAGHSNFDRVWRLSPDIVKLDRALVRCAAIDARAQRVVGQLVSLLHQCGALVLIEGIETQDEAFVALESNADLVQGDLFGSPQPTLARRCEAPPALQMLWQQYEPRRAERQRRRDAQIRPYIDAIAAAAKLLQSGEPLAVAVAAFLALPRAEVCYLLDHDALQIGDNAWAPQRLLAEPQAFAPMRDTRDAHWARRPYYRRAMQAPGSVQVTRPYRTLHGAHLCVTVSVAVRSGGDVRVVCGDLSWTGDVQ